jgi:hypothetical protein
MKPKKGIKIPKDEMKYAYPLYAVTQDKKLAERFRNERDMDLFIERSKKIHGVNSDEFIMANRSRMLSENYFETIIDKGTDDERPVFLNILHTETECEFTSQAIDTNAIFDALPGVLPMEVFSPSLRQALTVLRYNRVVEHVRTGLGNNADGVIDIGLQYDMFAVYMYYYGYTYRDDFTKKIKYVESSELDDSEIMAAFAGV